ncbi:hypothetical protein Q428_02915 [Fervidicella metallireducens AeB]|uniref:Uncharacterized protein n=1 Tax=Fervidicella metallireducens AeB TaxID=1403537 RepID=A0A017RXK4_9CLOT|nr:hypothetical protein [Fervidicella metallireducens]EYE89417.1 hypothetical protein Q428_02915 [Fervidicella metallireducens AeB]
MVDEKYYVLKDSGTYSNTLETYGLAELLTKINSSESKVFIEDKGMYYEITVNNPQRVEITYFDIFPYLKTKEKKEKQKDKDILDNDNIEKEITNYIDIEEEKIRNKKYSEFVKSINQQKNEARKKENPETESTLNQFDKKIKEYEDKPRNDWDVIMSVSILKAIDTYKNIYINLFRNKENFKVLVDCILELYKTPDENRDIIKKKLNQYKKNKVLVDIKEAASLQLYNPSMVKGAHSSKANGITPKAKDGFWLNECMKILGSYNSMIMKQVKVSSKDSDNKIYVFDVNKFNWDIEKKKAIFNEFKTNLKGYTSIKLDINSILLITKQLIKYHSSVVEKASAYRRKYRPKDEVKGLYSVYFKNMGNASSPVNISYLELPGFIELESSKDADDWLSIIDEHLNIINNIKISLNKQDETGSIIPLLQDYRMFLTTADINYFFNYVSAYSSFLMQQISKENYFVKPFTQKNMEVFLMKYDKKFSDIFENEGFKNIAKAIRASTISEQYAKSHGKQNFDIKYGLAQNLIRKSAYKDELITYLSEFIVSYNQETARYAEKNKGIRRTTIKQQDLEDIVKLIDEFEDSSLIGKMLCAYGYSLDRKKDGKEDSEIEDVSNE